ncbi:hypothetical protein CGRA01v4_01765 [Colletotrichum graminicola]|uniref:Ecp2 effector protein domain-containing protein n=1 Tax=Colletotrichum graminicola (strain M1.001 / M2 / FGSC 10212) TaxID=645133 RepID=E3QW85_COLGM|nr:uncharacterized protein GLRG_10263 [Colletotrichum graminicola M1.001]EFQ35119.1 hypothetical protein GLRG_10263 [Colletotrichum graminicola M1.001]WDK10486.1 hypothetical protein CGRA01v4_01765 [Colletotrichum graminicola]
MQGTQSLLQLLFIAITVAGLPQAIPTEPVARDIQKRAPFDPLERCKERRPAADELMLISYVGHNIVFKPSEQKFDSESGGRYAFLLDQSCERVVAEAQYTALGGGKGFSAKIGRSYDGTGPELGWQVTIESHVGVMGATFGINTPTIKINGEEKWKACSGLLSKNEGLDVDYWKVCNFRPGTVWPKPWWPYGNGW